MHAECREHFLTHSDAELEVLGYRHYGVGVDTQTALGNVSPVAGYWPQHNKALYKETLEYIHPCHKPYVIEVHNQMRRAYDESRVPQTFATSKPAPRLPATNQPTKDMEIDSASQEEQ